MGKMVTVTVAPRHSIHVNGVNGKPPTLVGPGGTVEVDESELERLFFQGFIVDPVESAITAEIMSKADVSAYVPIGVTVDEKSDQKIIQGRG